MASPASIPALAGDAACAAMPADNASAKAIFPTITKPSRIRLDPEVDH
jgi:hypothetical protein